MAMCLTNSDGSSDLGFEVEGDEMVWVEESVWTIKEDPDDATSTDGELEDEATAAIGTGTPWPATVLSMLILPSCCKSKS